ncbi:26s proteasome non-atpase regulatory subunit 4-like [Lichtheimia corymbifera JMRC:FSU:9682]|uniref:26s proteasome non-atpase regulatory subunit 4-like n=1 Tax=Lichtheimia corymbifera JMRC:FSU:9682 TaxID=1263082 RepID=A0A068RLK5_9FUNG|nr:26s proteasome non-atpase regulatory subunit 4-like [Lichtheimia corymbifera JMRC:FSU:9682]
MSLEASMIVIDNSEWMRNGDYTPTRLVAQNEAVNLIFSSKTQANRENTVGLMTMAGKSPEVLVTLTSDVGKILTALHGVKISNKADFMTGIQIAQLALKHRQNRNQRQRIIVFVGSPVETEERTLVRLAKKMKKNNVAVDIINFGEEAQNTAKLEAFINNVNNGDNSHLVSIPPGPHILSDMLLSTSILSGEEGAAAANFGSGGGGGGDFEFGVDPNLDPELALALRISLEEEKARQEAEAAKQGGSGDDKAQGESSSSGGDKMAVDSKPTTSQGEPSAAHDTEDAELQAALAMSMQDKQGSGAQDEDVHMEDLSEQDQLQRALEMSMNNEGGGDADEMMAVLNSLPGVDAKDERIQKALEGLQDKKDKDSKKDEDKDNK